MNIKDKCETMNLYVIKNAGIPLLGRDFIAKFQISINGINSIQGNYEINDMLQKFITVFNDEPGLFKPYKVNLKINENFTKPRTIPLVLKEKVERELERLIARGYTYTIDSRK